MKLVFLDILIGLVKFSYAILSNPMFWITFLGPMITSNNLKILRGKLGLDYNIDDISGTPEELKDLHNVINKNQWVYAWNDFNTQLFVTIISFILVLTESLRITISMFYQCGTVKTLTAFTNSPETLSLLLCLFGLIVYSIYIFIGGEIISVEILKKYFPKDGKITGENKYPPKTLLTYYRGSLILYGLLFSLWQSFVLSNIIKTINLASIQ